jgi:hypothetical protein
MYQHKSVVKTYQHNQKSLEELGIFDILYRFFFKSIIIVLYLGSIRYYYILYSGIGSTYNIFGLFLIPGLIFISVLLLIDFFYKFTRARSTYSMNYSLGLISYFIILFLFYIYIALPYSILRPSLTIIIGIIIPVAIFLASRNQ